jgi:hypothetical protein
MQSLPRFDAETGRWPSVGYGQMVENAQKDPAGFRRALSKFAREIGEARKLLKRARPKSRRQRQRVAFWTWACETLSHFADFGPQLLIEPGRHDVATLQAFRKKALGLAKKTGELLLQIYTPRTVAEEQQCRFGSHLEYIDRMEMMASTGKG